MRKAPWAVPPCGRLLEQAHASRPCFRQPRPARTPRPCSCCRSCKWRGAHALWCLLQFGLTSRSDRATPSGEHRAWRPAGGPSGAAPRSGHLAVTPERRRDAPVKREGSGAEQLQGAIAADGRKRESSTVRSSRCDIIKLYISLKLRCKQTSRSCRGARLGVCPAAPQGRLGGGRRTDDDTSEGSGGLARPCRACG